MDDMVGSPARRVFVVDADMSARDQLCALLSRHDLHATGFATAESFLEGFDAEHALCIVIDLNLPGMQGRELQRLLVGRGIAVPIVFLTAHGDIPTAVDAMKWGAADFLEKPASEAQLLSAIAAAEDLIAARPPARILRSVAAARLAKLTVREREVLDHLILGMTNKHIADELGISQRTVEIHRARIREKMEARGLSDLIRMMR